MSDDLIKRVCACAESSGCEYYKPVSPATIARAESELGFALPPLIVRLYTEVANGGFGPGYGLLGLIDPCQDGDQTVVSLYRENIAAHENPEVDHTWHNGLIMLCDWGCCIYTCVDCRSEQAQIVTHDPELTWTHWTLESWLDDWVRGVDIHARMFEPSESVMRVNPFTGDPFEFTKRGRAKY